MRARPDRKLLSEISRQYRGLECGKLIVIAHKYKRQHNYLEATRAYAAARNTLAFQSAGWQCVEAWRGERVEVAGAAPAAGVLLGLAPDGALQLRTDAGQILTLHTGSLRRTG